jgi:hypothetical protein
MTMGKGDSRQYIYEKVYYRKGASGSWNEISLVGSNKQGGAWFPRSATGFIPTSDQDLQETTQVVGYICTWTGSQWKCGCRDNACTQPYWQLQEVGR